MKSINRRGFIIKGITSTVGIMALSPSIVAASEQKENIIYRTLGKTGLKVPIISFGLLRADIPNLCKAAYEKGIKLFDTAYVYQNGKSETMLGNLFKDYPRNTYFLATKVKPEGVNIKGQPIHQITAKSFIEKFNTSLSRLKTDFVDILYVHKISNPEILEYKPILNAVRKLKKDGKIKFIGLSTHQNEPAVINAAALTDRWDVIMTSYNFKYDNISELNSAIRKANKAGIGIIAMKTMAGGGFLDKEKTKPINTTAALKWVLSNPDIHTTVPGMTTFDQLDLNVKILSDITMTEAEKKDILVARTEPGLYCNGCNKCISACPMNLPVPDLMRAYMYAYGYSNPAMSFSLFRELCINENPCKECNTCKVKCTKNFYIKEKIADISRLVTSPTDFMT